MRRPELTRTRARTGLLVERDSMTDGVPFQIPPYCGSSSSSGGGGGGGAERAGALACVGRAQ